jgi:hypothetical protein
MKISENALIKRINRAVRRRFGEDVSLRKSLGDQARREFGEYYLQDDARNYVLRTHVNLKALAQEVHAIPGTNYGRFGDD